jgi:hypothetical protein
MRLIEHAVDERTIDGFIAGQALEMGCSIEDVMDDEAHILE